MRGMMRKSDFAIAGSLVILIATLGFSSMILERNAVANEQTVEAPMFEVDPFWPKPLPNHWIMGSTIGVSVDSRDHVWVIHRAVRIKNV